MPYSAPCYGMMKAGRPNCTEGAFTTEKLCSYDFQHSYGNCSTAIPSLLLREGRKKDPGCKQILSGNIFSMKGP